MSVGLNSYRARIGMFHNSSQAFRDLPFLSSYAEVVSFVMLLYSKREKEVLFSLLIYFYYSNLRCVPSSVLKSNFSSSSLLRSVSTGVKTHNYQFTTGTPVNFLICLVAFIPLVESIANDSSYQDPSLPILILITFAMLCKRLLQLSGDIESNPGPLQQLKIVHVNARSLSTKLDLFIAESHAYDIMTISETWLSDSDSNVNLAIPNFHLPIRRDRPGDRHGGVAIYVRDTLICKPRPDLQVPGLEAVWIETKIGQESFLVGSFYRPESPVQYWDLISESVSKANDSMLKFIILGDFNTDFLNNPARHLVDILTRYQLVQLINFPTRITDTSRTCLDLIITQNPLLVKEVVDHPPFCSDHNAPSVTLQPFMNKQCSFKRTIYIYDKLNKLKFLEMLRNVNWIALLTSYSIDKSCELFTSTFMNIVKQCVPTKNVTIRPNDAPWFTHDLKTIMNRRNKMYKKAKRTKRNEDWLSFHRIRNEVINLIRNRKAEYYNKLNDQVNDTANFGQKSWWKIVRQFMNKQGIDSNEIPPLTRNGRTYYSNSEKATVLNEFFVRQSTLNIPADENLPDIERKDTELRDIFLTTSEVKNVLQGLDSSKATGPDEIPNRLLIISADILSNPLTVFFNRCLTDCKFPTQWKTAHITPIHKNGNKDECSNYRPVSLLSCVGKVFERCVYKHLYSYLIDNNLITTSQSGFMKGDSTVNQLISIYNDFVRHYDSNTTTQAVFFDISKAFDRVWHRGLIHKMEAVGVRGKLLEWLHDYLSSRFQTVVIKGEMSNKLLVPAGVPQGSVLGPLLFLVYINDIVINIESTIKLFADDTSTSLSMENPVMQADILNSDLDKINTWASVWKVKFNESKTEQLNIKRGSSTVYDLTFGNQILTGKDSHKHLGVVFQDDCKWGKHITSIINKTSLLINCLRSFKYYLSRKALETMYKSFILPIFDYADVVWDNCTEYQANMLEDLHLDALRTITGTVRRTSHGKILLESGFSSLKERRRRHKVMTFYKIINGICPSYLSEIAPPLVSSINPYHRRRPLERQEPMCRTEIYHRSFFPSATALWNNLPDNIKNFQSISQLKNYLRTSDSIVPQYYYRGKRKEQILHCRLRLGMSDLNHDLFERHLQQNPSCSCQYPNETAEHYLLHCTNFTNQRQNTILTIPANYRNIENLLYGNHTLQIKENEEIFDKAQAFIEKTKRFENI